MRPPGKYDELRQAEQPAQEARDAPSQPKAAAQPDSAQEEPERPTGHPATFAKVDWAKQIAEAAKERADAADRASAQAKGKDDHGR